ncbi:right-handed parallel beta-helix repeat-containing protein [uncultured Methanobrevibacter sp.]|uniref:right-handed parallel beta-helix repeat-containing protein n=1 Tax=uncultured Methanobrevibacter sp. TaxID=253161 RepID=UPI002621FEB3|nr:right-handed parallel beta-helix repeat-containing protein [uncultured Methanobrevibacter sp.]
MKITKILIVVLLIILTMCAVSASDDNVTSDSLAVGGDEALQIDMNSDIIADGNASGSFSDLNKIISNSKRGDVIQLDKDYLYNNTTDSSFKDGIEISKRITVYGQGHEIDGSNLARIFDVRANSVTLKNISFVNAYASDAGGAINGGERLSVTDCSFENCTGGDGGAVSAGDISISGCSFTDCVRIRGGEYGGGGALSLYGATVSNCSFVNCYSDCEAGAIRVVDNYKISNCNFVNCSATNETGALRLYDKGTVAGCSFVNCSATNGFGAIYSNGNGPVSVSNCSFTNCSSLEGYCGAVCLTDEDWTISDCNFTGCSAYHAGGALELCGKGIASNCCFVDCYSTEGGGAIDIWNDDDHDNEKHLIQIVDCSFVRCSSQNISGAIWGRLHYSSLSDCTFINCSVTGSDTNGGGAVWGAFTSISDCSFENCSADNAAALVIGPEPDVDMPESDVDNHLRYVSNCSFVNCYSYNQGGAISAGDNVIVSNCSFKRCISEGDNNAIRAGNNVSIYDCSFIDCSSKVGVGEICFFGAYNGVVSRCTFVNSTSENGAIQLYNGFNHRVSDCSFVNCYAYGDAGAIYFGSENSVIEKCSFVNCIAENNGGAIWFNSRNGNIVECTFEGCTADNGGAIFADGENLTISNTLFKSNTAYDRGGGAIFSWHDLTIDNSTFVDNFADNCNGGALYLNDKIIVKNSTFKGNKAYQGNSIWTSESNLTAVSNNFMLAKGESRDDILYGIPLKSIRNDNYVYLGDRLIVEPDIDISCSDIIVGENENVNVVLPSDATGKVTLTLSSFGKTIKTSTFDLEKGIPSEVYSNLALGVYTVNVQYVGDVNYYDTSKVATFTVRPKVEIAKNVTVGGDVAISMDFADAEGNIVVLVDGKKDSVVPIKNNKIDYVLKTGSLIARNHTVTFQYEGNSFDNAIFNQTGGNIPFEYEMYLDPKEITIKEEKLGSTDVGVVVLELPKTATGTVGAFVNGVQVDVLGFMDGIAQIDLSQFKNGNYNVVFEYSGDEIYDSFTKEMQVTVNIKVSKITASNGNVVYASNGKYSVKVYGGDYKLAKNIKVTFLINNKVYKTATSDKNGVASIVIDKTPGSYQITAKAYNVNVTKTLTVKHLVTLKSATVKRSAKSLVLQASLGKVAGKYLKNKKITFTFNGKKYTAKTNAKGVAKVTIKSTVLKKLKAGKKVTYQATYSKDTVKKTVAVKK